MSIIKPQWFANLPSATGIETRQFYSRWFEEATGAQRAFVADIMKQYPGASPADIRMLFPYDCEPLRTHYAATPFQGKYLVNRIDVVHVKMSVDRLAMDLGDRVFAAVAGGGIRTSRVCHTRDRSCILTRRHDGVSYDVYVTPYIDGHHPYGTAEDIFNVGRGLGELYNRLSALPPDLVSEIRTSSRPGIERHMAGARWILAHRNDFVRQFPANGERVASLAESYIEADQNSWVSNHFNMILGDVMLDLKGKLVVLDNERIADGWAPRHGDVGMAVSRIALEALMPDGSTPPQASEQVMPLLEGYNRASGVGLTRQALLDSAVSALAVGKVFGVASQMATGNHSAGLPVQKKMERFMGMIELVTALER